MIDLIRLGDFFVAVFGVVGACKTRLDTDVSRVKSAATDAADRATVELVPKDARDLPPVGRSLFDQLFFVEGSKFPRELARLSRLLQMKYGATVEGVDAHTMPPGATMNGFEEEVDRQRMILALKAQVDQ